jgi:ABC-type multidrug transport system fused ATPase/permease subunit
MIVRLRHEIAAKADLRGSTLSNIIEGIRVIKISTLERIFIEEMAEKRADEISKYKELAFGKSVPFAVYVHSIGLIVFIPLLIYVAVGGSVSLDLAVAFLNLSMVT